MKYLDFIEKRLRMCNAMDHDCTKCLFRPHMGGADVFYCYAFCVKLPSIAISLLQIWEKENPYLEKCPFCGGGAKIETSSNGTLYFVNCVSCRAAACASTEKEKAVEKWNRRAAVE